MRSGYALRRSSRRHWRLNPYLNRWNITRHDVPPSGSLGILAEVVPLLKQSCANGNGQECQRDTDGWQGLHVCVKHGGVRAHALCFKSSWPPISESHQKSKNENKCTCKSQHGHQQPLNNDTKHNRHKPSNELLFNEAFTSNPLRQL